MGTLPTTVIPASWGIFNASDAPGFLSAMYAVPPGMLLSAVFLWVWRVLPPRLRRGSLGWRLLLVTLISLGTWLLAALLWVLTLQRWAATLTQQGIASLIALATLAAVGFWATARAPKTTHVTRPVRRRVLVLRGIGAGCAIAFAVALAQSGNPLAAGAAAVFPAIFLTTMVSLWLSQG